MFLHLIKFVEVLCNRRLETRKIIGDERRPCRLDGLLKLLVGRVRPCSCVEELPLVDRVPTLAKGLGAEPERRPRTLRKLEKLASNVERTWPDVQVEDEPGG